MRAGDLRHRLKLQSRTTDLDDRGFPSSTGWTDIATVWAARADTGGQEQFEETAEVSALSVDWEIRHRDDVSAVDRAVDATSTGDVYDVIAARDPDGRRERLILATERRT